jgi:isopenicillin-N epimerase
MLELTGLSSLYSSNSWYAQMVSAFLPVETDIVVLKARLYEEFKIEVPLMEWNNKKLVRVSVQGYNTREDVERLVEALMMTLG